MSIQIPDIKIKNILEAFLTFVKADYEGKVNKDETWLYRVFYEVTSGDFNFYTEAINIFVTRGEKYPNKLEVRMNFDPSKAKDPSFFVNVPSEKGGGGTEDAIGMGQSDENYYENADGSYVEKYIRNFKGDYEIMVTSSNEMEVKLLYRFLQAALVSLSDTWADVFAGTFYFYGKQLIPNHEIIPYPYFMQVVVIQVDSRIEAPRVGLSSYGTDITFVQESVTI